MKRRRQTATKRAVRTLELERMIRVSELCAKLNVSRQGLFKMRRRGDLPPAVRFSRNSIGWPESVIREWLGSRPAA